MSLIWTESCNVQGLSAVRYDSGTQMDLNNQLLAGRFEGQHLRPLNWIKLNAFANDPLMIFGFNWYGGTNTANDSCAFRFFDVTTEQARVSLWANSTPGQAGIRAYRGASTLLGTVNTTFIPGVWHYIEIEILIDDSSGYVNVYVDDVLTMNITGVDTKAGSNAYINGFIISRLNNHFYGVDELYVLNGQGSVNNARIGPKRVSSFDLSGDGASSQWVPSTGTSNFSLVDERAAVNAADYVSSDTPNDLDLYTLAAKSLPDLGFDGVNVITVASEEGLTNRQIRAAIRSGGNNYFGATKDLISSVLAYTNIWETNPDTSSPFTSSGIDSMGIGQELVS